MGRELQMFEPPGTSGHGHSAEPLTIALGGGRFEAAADGAEAPRRHPDWIRARVPTGPNYQELKGLMRDLTHGSIQVAILLANPSRRA